MQSNGDIVRQFIEKVLNQGDVDAAVEFFWEDMVEQVPLPGQGPGVEGLKGALRGLRAAFPDMHWTVQEQIAEAPRWCRASSGQAHIVGHFSACQPRIEL